MLPVGEATYICGPNGSGKTDIYRAIRWVLFGKRSDKVHPTDTSTTVGVSLRMGKIRVLRTALPDTITVHNDTKVMQGEDAEATIRAIYGTRDAWELSSYVRGIHPFITANSQKRVEILNEITEEGKARDVLLALISRLKAEVKTLSSNYDKEMIRYEAVYGSEPVLTSKILLEQDRLSLTAELSQARKLQASYQTQIDLQASLTKNISGLAARIAQIGEPSNEILVLLREQAACSTKYTLAKKNLDRLQAMRIPAATIAVTPEMIDTAIVTERNHAASVSSFSKLDVSHNPQAVRDKIKDYELSLEYSEIALANSRYIKLRDSCPAVASSVLEATQQALELQQEMDRLSLLIKYAPALEIEANYARTASKLVKVDVDLHTYAADLERQIDQQQVYLDRDYYEQEYFKIVGNQAAADAVTVVLDLMNQIRDSIAKIEQSKVVMTCPCCSGNLVQVGNKLAKFEGEVATGDTVVLRRRLQLLTKLATIKYPAIPNCARLSSIDDARQQARLARELIVLEAKRVKIPTGIDRLKTTVAVANASLVNMKAKLATVQQCKAILTELASLPPLRDIPAGIKVVSDSVAREQIKQLDRLVYVPKPTVSVATLKQQLELQAATMALEELVKPERLVTETEVREYSSKLTQFELLSRQLEDAQTELALITVTREMLTEVRARVREIEAKLAADKKYTTMDLQAVHIETIADDLDKKRAEYDAVLEYFEHHFKPGSDIRLSDCSRGLANDVNALLSSCESKIRITIPLKSDRTKIVCYSNGKKIGAPTELSDGELSLVSFAFRICFCLMRKSDSMIILDEVTREMSANVKDKCIELAIEIAKSSGKTLLVTDHTSICGDYYKVIDLTK
ncbi:Hypothetical protein POVR2_LOCUS219 [uncultured virus]|nr:Hypothetical protein POVR2_LOCUS219 [uncultured virus]